MSKVVVFHVERGGPPQPQYQPAEEMAHGRQIARQLLDPRQHPDVTAEDCVYLVPGYRLEQRAYWDELVVPERVALSGATIPMLW